jgi:hypothetical protein
MELTLSSEQWEARVTWLRRQRRRFPYQIQRVGNQHFLFTSDFPHEISPDDILHEIEEVKEAPLQDDDKLEILR